MIQTRSLLSDGAWLASMQGFAALGQLIGIRLLTEVLPPSVFGEFSLWLGLVVLVATGLANPTIQAMLRYYPEYTLQERGSLVKSVARRQLTRLIAWLSPGFLIGAIITLVYDWSNGYLLAILVLLIVIEIIRMQNMALLNASRSHRAYGAWIVAESWGRPLMAWLMVSITDADAIIVLAAYFLSSVIALVVMRKFVPHDVSINTTVDEKNILINKFWQYSLPLLPLGILGWVSGMADRYMIAALLSPAEVGLYVAIYGLASRPMLMFGGVVENIIRPAYQHALAENDSHTVNSLLRKWLMIVVFGSCVAVIVTWLGHHWFAYALLGEQYRSVSYLMPWIVIGYVVYLQYQVVGRVLYARGATGKILLAEGVGAVLAIIIGFLSIQQAGILGAAIAISFYFGIQFVMSLVFARKWLFPDKVESLNRGVN